MNKKNAKKVGNIMSQMSSLTKKNHLEKRDKIATNNRTMGETMCKFWTRSGKMAKPRDLIYALRKTGNSEQDIAYEKRSEVMASLAREYHDDLQRQYTDVPREIREEKIAKVLNNIRMRTTPLYERAETRIMINGVLSAPWQVTRGVRQGDPLSCLLFDLTIEPLAASLRESDLKGFRIPGHSEKLVANLFADDTTTFLSAEDDLQTLEEILEDWCIASRAKFNTTKTEIIPMGVKEFREELTRSRRLRSDAQEYQMAFT